MTGGLLVATFAIAASGMAIAARVFPSPRPLRDRAVLGGLVALALPIACVRALSPFRAILPALVLAAIVATSGAMLAVAGPRARRQAALDACALVRGTAQALTAGTAAALAWLGVAALGCAAFAAWRFSPWAWDALGYHLPIVNDAIATHTLRTVPTHIAYVNAYPRAVETFFVAVRSLLSHDTWIDFAQAPFGLLACVATAAFARRSGALPARAAACGVGLLAVPLVMLQLATNYVDVAVAAFLASSVYFATNPELSAADLGAWALATGLLLGCKPSSPPVVIGLACVVALRVVRDRGVRTGGLQALAACVGVLALGGETYIANIAAHGNPIWPIALDLGPLHLLGEDRAGPLFVQGLPAELARAPWLRRVLTSLFVEPDEYIYDMRLGGLGPLSAWGLLPLAALAAARNPWRAWPAVLLGACALASPAAHWMRFALALPCALLALSSVALLSSRGRIVGDVALAVLAAIGIARALPGLYAGGGGVDGREALWSRLRDEIRPGESFAYDASFSLPGQLTCPDGRAGAPVYLGDARTPDEVDRALASGRARVVLAGDSAAAREAIRRAGDRYRFAFRCPLDECDVFVRQSPAP